MQPGDRSTDFSLPDRIEYRDQLSGQDVVSIGNRFSNVGLNPRQRAAVGGVGSSMSGNEEQDKDASRGQLVSLRGRVRNGSFGENICNAAVPGALLPLSEPKYALVSCKGFVAEKRLVCNVVEL